MTQQPEHDFPYYRSPAAIRGESFSHRMRGLDEDEVREYLHLLADQIEASERERSTLHAEIERLRGEVEGLHDARPESAQDEINPQAVLLFSQAQQVADQLVEEAVVHARDLMASARHQQREIMEQARRSMPTEGARDATGARTSLNVPSTDGASSVAEVEYVQTFARVAQVQLRSVLEALSEEVERLGEVSRFHQQSFGSPTDPGTPAAGEASDPLTGPAPSPRDWQDRHSQ